VFVSYQTRTHRERLPLITELLRESGADYWVDTEQKLHSSRLEGRELSLVRAMQSADVLLFLQPEGGRRLTFTQKLVDVLDFIAAALAIEGHAGFMPLFVPFFYYARYWRFFYGINLFYLGRESWQSWEEHAGEQLGLTIVRVEPPRPFPQVAATDDAWTQQFRSYWSEEVAPKIRSAPRRRKPEMLPRGKQVVEIIQQAGVWLSWAYLAAMAVALLILVALVVAGGLLFGWRFLLPAGGLIAVIAAFIAVRDEPPDVLLFIAGGAVLAVWTIHRYSRRERPG